MVCRFTIIITTIIIIIVFIVKSNVYCTDLTFTLQRKTIGVFVMVTSRMDDILLKRVVINCILIIIFIIACVMVKVRYKNAYIYLSRLHHTFTQCKTNVYR